MFVRKKKNRSGVISVQIIDKSTGKYKMIKTIGSSNDADQIEKLVKEGENWIKQKLGLLEFDFSNEKQKVEQFFESIEQITVHGTELLLGKLFDEIGFNQIPDVLFRQLVLARLFFPVSKLKTTDYLTKYQFLSVDVQTVYRYLDRFYRTQKETVQRISYDHTLKVLGGEISIIFYDVTTLYFEIDDEDNLRGTGFSKDGKHQNPQIVLGLLVSIEGYPLAYEIFEGNKFEGHTMLPVIEAFKIKYRLNNLVIIVDSGLLSNDNIQELQQKGYNFILGARIKSESQTVKNKILSLQLNPGESKIVSKKDKNRLIISCSVSKAKKDKANREKGLRKFVFLR